MSLELVTVSCRLTLATFFVTVCFKLGLLHREAVVHLDHPLSSDVEHSPPRLHQAARTICRLRPKPFPGQATGRSRQSPVASLGMTASLPAGGLAGDGETVGP